MVNFNVVEGDIDQEYQEAFDIYNDCKTYVDQGYSLLTSIRKVTDIPVTANKPVYRRVRDVFLENGYVKHNNNYIREDLIVVTVADLKRCLEKYDDDAKVVIGNNHYITSIRNVFHHKKDNKIALVSESFTKHRMFKDWEII